MSAAPNENASRAGPRQRGRIRLIDLFLIIAAIAVPLAIYSEWGIDGIPFSLLVLGLGITALGRWRRWFTWLEILVIWLILGTLGGLSLPAVHFDHGNVKWNLHVLWKELDIMTERQHRSLPPSAQAPGEFPYSWRLAVAEFEASGPIGIDRTKSWDVPVNETAAKSRAHNFQCYREGRDCGAETSYVAIVGPETCWPEEGLAENDIPDGKANTLLVVDSHRSGIVWTEPRDFNYETMNWKINGGPGSIQADHGHYTQYLDGSRKPRGARSTLILMTDGSIHSVSENIDPQVLKQLANRSDGEPKNWPAK